MVSLVDIIPQTRIINISAGELVLHGLGLRQIADLFLTFPSLQDVFTEGAADVTAAALIVHAPDAIGAIIAAAADQPEAAETISSGAVLTPDEVLDCLTAIGEITFPRGIAPLLERLMALVAGLVVSHGANAGRGAATNVPSPPSNSSPPAMMAAQ